MAKFKKEAAPIMEETAIVENIKVEKVAKKQPILNLQDLAKLPKEFYQYSSYTGKLEPCELDKEDFKGFKSSKGTINLVVAVYEPLTLLLDDNKDKVDVPFNKPQIISIPLSSFKSALQTVIKGFFQFSKPIIDKETGLVVSERFQDYFQIRSFYEMFAFAYCVKVDDILDPIKQKSSANETNANIQKYAKDVINAVQNITIGTCKIPLNWLLHIPFHLEVNNGGAVFPITKESLEATYQNIINR